MGEGSDRTMLQKVTTLRSLYDVALYVAMPIADMVWVVSAQATA